MALLAQRFATDTARSGLCGAATPSAELWGNQAPLPAPAAGGFWGLSDAICFSHCRGTLQPLGPSSPPFHGTKMSWCEWLTCFWLNN